MHLHRKGRFLLFAAIGLLLATPAEGHAQIPSLKKAISKTFDQAKAATVPAGPPEAFTDVLLELNPVRLTQVIAGKEAGRLVAQAAGGPTALRKRLEDVEARLSQVTDANRKVIDAWDEKGNAMEACRDEAFQQRRQARKEEFKSRMLSDQVFARKVGELSLAAQNAQAKGDTALMRKLGAEAGALTALTGADTAAVDKTCGSLADAPAAVREIAALEQQKTQLTQDIRQAETAVSEAEAQGSQMTAKQFGIAWERVELYLGRRRAAQQQTGFSPTELQALAARADELEKLLK